MHGQPHIWLACLHVHSLAQVLPLFCTCLQVRGVQSSLLLQWGSRCSERVLARDAHAAGTAPRHQVLTPSTPCRCILSYERIAPVLFLTPLLLTLAVSGIRAYHTSTSQLGMQVFKSSLPCAPSCLSRSCTAQTRQRICTEVSTLQNAQCPFILKCFDSFEDQGWWWLVLENCAAGDLYHIVQENGPIWEEGWLVSQVSKGRPGVTNHTNIFLPWWGIGEIRPVIGGFEGAAALAADTAPFLHTFGIVGAAALAAEADKRAHPWLCRCCCPYCRR